MAPPVEIQDGCCGDIAAICGVEERCGLNVWSVQSYRNIIQSAESTFQVAWSREEPPRVVGFYLACAQDEEAQILKLAVEPERQREGIGGRLLLVGLQDALVRGCRRCFLEVRAGNERAIRFYRKNGFETVALRKNYYHNPREDALVMCKHLDPG